MERVNRNFTNLTADEIHETLMFHVKHLYMMTEEEYQSLLCNENVVCAMVFWTLGALRWLMELNTLLKLTEWRRSNEY